MLIISVLHPIQAMAQLEHGRLRPMKRSRPSDGNHRKVRDNLVRFTRKGSVLALSSRDACAGAWRSLQINHGRMALANNRGRTRKVERQMRESALIWINRYIVVSKPARSLGRNASMWCQTPSGTAPFAS
jgi:hypothetical protein